MNTEHLFGLYWVNQRLRAAEGRARGESDLGDPRAPTNQPTSAAARDAAYQRLFDAVRSAVEDSHNRP